MKISKKTFLELILIIVLTFSFCSLAPAQTGELAGDSGLAVSNQGLGRKLGDSLNLSIGGWGKVRLENISASEREVTGIYGEELVESTEVSHRFFLEGVSNLGSYFQVGALLRLSSEDDEALLDGPVYLKNPYGSVFARFRYNFVDLRLGYYEIYFTPLTLMRFDRKDIPELGGSSGCNCPSGGGGIGGTLLEDIEEELTFEGGRIYLTFGDFIETTLLYARSQQAEDGERYRRHTAGARVMFRYYIPAAGEDMIVSLQFLNHDDEGCSVSRAPSYNPVENRVGSLYAFYPLHRNLKLFAEYAVSESVETTMRAEGNTEDNTDGRGATVGLQFNWPRDFTGDLAYLYRSEDFESLYSALTYLPNRQGGRLNSAWFIGGTDVIVDLFFKYLEEVEAEVPGDPARFISVSSGVTYAPQENISFNVSGLWDSQKRDSKYDGSDLDVVSVSGLASASYEIFKDNYLELKYQYINYNDGNDSQNDYDAHVSTVEMRIKF